MRIPDPRLRSVARPFVRGARRVARRFDAMRIRAELARLPGATAGARVESVQRARSGTWIVAMRSDDGPGTVVKLTDRAEGARQLVHEGNVLTALRRTISDAEVLRLLPELVGRGNEGRWTYLVQSRLPGVAASTVVAAGAPTSAWLAEASTMAYRLSSSTGTDRSVGSDDLTAWVARPLELVAELTGSPSGALSALAADLRDALADRKLHRGAVHGDLWSQNLLVDPASGRLVGIVDWDSADLAGLALHDQLHLVLYTRKVMRGTEIGTEICRALAGEAEAGEPALPTAERGGWEPIGRRGAIMLYWLRLVATNLARQPKVTRRRRWVDANVRAVLACL